MQAKAVTRRANVAHKIVLINDLCRFVFRCANSDIKRNQMILFRVHRPSWHRRDKQFSKVDAFG